MRPLHTAALLPALLPAILLPSTAHAATPSPAAASLAVQVPTDPIEVTPGQPLQIPVLIARDGQVLRASVAPVTLESTGSGLVCQDTPPAAWKGLHVTPNTPQAVTDVTTFNVDGTVPQLAPGDHLLGILATAMPAAPNTSAQTVTVRAQACLHVIVHVPGHADVNVTPALTVAHVVTAGTRPYTLGITNSGTSLTSVTTTAAKGRLLLQPGMPVTVNGTADLTAPYGFALRRLSQSVIWTDANGDTQRTTVTVGVFVWNPVVVVPAGGVLLAAALTPLGMYLARARARSRRPAHTPRHARTDS